MTAGGAAASKACAQAVISGIIYKSISPAAIFAARNGVRDDAFYRQHSDQTLVRLPRRDQWRMVE